VNPTASTSVLVGAPCIDEPRQNLVVAGLKFASMGTPQQEVRDP
jgi:hypothetical protein